MVVTGGRPRQPCADTPTRRPAGTAGRGPDPAPPRPRDRRRRAEDPPAAVDRLPYRGRPPAGPRARSDPGRPRGRTRERRPRPEPGDRAQRGGAAPRTHPALRRRADGPREHLPARRPVPRLRSEFDPGTSLYAYIRGTGVTFHAASEHIETVLASPREAALFGTNPALPMLPLNRISRDADGRPIERVRSLFRGDRFSLVAELGG